jgi:7-keto-8-aminopelargonate synthetase-like enzyme
MPLAEPLRFIDRTRVLSGGKAYLFFAGTDYHRLGSHPEVIRAFQEAALAEGLSCAGSRVTTGNHPLLDQLEAGTAAFLGAGSAALCSGGYLANTVAVEAIGAHYQRFFVDAEVHASMAQAVAGLPRERVHPFQGADPPSLGRELALHLRPRERPLVLTDGVVSGSGALPALGAYWELIRDRGGKLLVDDAHGLGVVGATGKGSPEQAGLPAEAWIQTGTYAKAFGVFGGLVAGSASLAAQVVARSRAFVGATPMPPPVAAAALRSMALLRAHPQWITGLQARTLAARRRLAELGFPAVDSPAPILSVTHLDVGKNRRLRTLLLKAGIYPSFINYPGSPPGGHFRFTLSSVHTDEEVERLLQAIALSCS